MTILSKNATNGEKYLPAMGVQTEAEASEWFEVCVQHTMSAFGKTREEAERHERGAIACAAYFGFHEKNDTIERVARLFHIEDEIKNMVT